MRHSFILANITWNGKGWEGPSPDRSGFKWIAKDPEKHIAGESWNFAPTRNASRRGFFENIGRDVRHFRDGGVVFFASRNISEKKKLIVGFYSGAKVFPPKRKPTGHHYSIEAPTDCCLRLPEYLLFNPRRHVPRGKTLSRYFVYLSEREARNIFSDMMSLPLDSTTKKKLEVIARRYFPDIKPATRKSTHQNLMIGSGEIKAYERKELDEHTDKTLVKLVKNNAMLRESFVNHEKTKSKVADYLKEKGFRIFRDKHLDLLARKRKQSLIVEVKSCRDGNVELQVRHGISQLFFYSYIYEKKLGRARCCLALQCEPPEKLLHFVVDHCGFDLAYISGGRVVYLNGK